MIYLAGDALSNWLTHNAPDHVRELFSVHTWATEFVHDVKLHGGVHACMNSEYQLRGGLWLLMDKMRQHWDANHEDYKHCQGGI